jgi:antitoxin component YwqK of YwqJK toxin-antitoxin module
VKTIIIQIISLCVFLPAIGQQEKINQWSSDGVRTGKWETYDENGKITCIAFYRPFRKKVPKNAVSLLPEYNEKNFNWMDSTLLVEIPVGEWKLFWPDGKLKETRKYDDITGRSTGKWNYYWPDGKLKETEEYKGGQPTGKWARYSNNGLVEEQISYASAPGITDQYQYDSSGALKFITRKTNNRITYIIGSLDSAEVNHMSMNMASRVGEFHLSKSVCRNLSDRDITLTVEANPAFELASTTYQIRKGDSVNLNFNLKAPAGAAKGIITLKTNEWRFPIEVRSYGYHITTTDFLNNTKLQVPAKFIYYRTETEYQLEILKHGETVPKFFPLSKQKTEIALTKGSYAFTATSPSGRRTKPVEVR